MEYIFDVFNVLTAAEYKARIEAERTAKVQAQIDRKAAQSTGVPW